MRRAPLLAVATALLVLLPGPPLSAAERRFSLSGAVDGAERLELRGEADSATFDIVVPPVGDVVDAAVTLRWENGVDVLPEASRLTLIVNDQPVAELPMTAFKGVPLSASIKIPIERVRVGLNRVVLRQDAVNRAACRPNGAFDLWTRIDLAKSALVFNVEGKPPAPDLSRLDVLWAANDAAGEPLIVATPGTEVRADHLGWGALVASAYGRVLGRRAPVIAVAAVERGAPLRVPGAKTVLVAPVGELAGIIPREKLDRVAGPHLAVLATEGGTVTLVTGRTPEEVDVAARRLADRSRPLPTETWMNVDPTDRPTDAAGTPTTPLHVTLAELGMSSVEHSGFRYSAGVDVTLPADYTAVADRVATARVDGAFDGDLGPGAKLTIFVNDRSAGMLEMDRRSTTRLERTEIRLPMTYFRGGRNRVVFEAEMPPRDEGDCSRNVRKPRFVLRDTTSLEFQGFARVLDLPDLGVTARTGAPYVSTDDRAFDLIVSDGDPRWRGAALTLVARLAQVAPNTPRAVPYIGRRDPGPRNALIVGPVDSLPNSALNVEGLGAGRLAALLDAGARVSAAGTAMPEDERRRLIALALGASKDRPGDTGAAKTTETSRWERVATGAPETAPAPTGGTAGVARRVLGIIVDRARGVIDGKKTGERADDPVAVLEGGRSAPDAALIQFEGEAGSGATRTVLTAVDGPTIERATRRLVGAAVWERVGGAVTLWRDGEEPPIVIRPSRAYRLIETPGDVGNMLLIAATYLSSRVEILFGLLLVFVVTLAIAAHLMLRGGRPGVR